jgi:CheY-like chemotaxis protein
MTANAMEGDRELCLSAGMDDYISKPIKADDLYTLLHKLPGHQGGTEAVAVAADDAFDFAAALASADPEIVEVIAPLFLEGIDEDLEALKRAVAAGESKLGCRQAHTLRGIVGNFSAEPVVRQARAIEDALHRGDAAAAEAQLPALSESLALLAQVLRDRLQVR